VRRLAAHLRYLTEEALDDWRRSPGVAILATTTLAAVLFVAGLVLLTLANISAGLQVWRGDARVEVYLRDGARPADVEAVRHALAAAAGIARVEFVDKDEALRRFRAAYRGLAELSGELESNPLPASFEAYLTPGVAASEAARAASSAVAGLPGVEESRFDRESLAQVEAVLDLARWVGIGLAGLVGAASIFVMAGVMRLTVYARRDEISIMLLVGASPSFVRGPYLAAGLAQGLAAGALALVLVEAVRRTALAYAGGEPTSVVGFVAGGALPAGHALAVLAAGVLVGLASAWFAVQGGDSALHSAFDRA
jgi:cell division transport system permease protein